MRENVDAGQLEVNTHSGSDDEALGGGVTAFRMSAQLAGAISELLKDLDPRVKNRSILLRTAVTAWVSAWFDLRESSPSMNAALVSIRAEKMLMNEARRQEARTTIIGRLKYLGRSLAQHASTNSMDAAITLADTWVRVIMTDPDIEYKRIYSEEIRKNPELRELILRATELGRTDIELVRDFILAEDDNKKEA